MFRDCFSHYPEKFYANVTLFDENFINFYRFLILFKTGSGKSVWKWTIPRPDLPKTVFKDHIKNQAFEFLEKICRLIFYMVFKTKIIITLKFLLFLRSECNRGMVQLASILAWGASGRPFESGCSD